MSQVPDSITSRDFSSGRIAKSALATSLMPNFSQHTLQSAVNSVSNSENVDYSEIIGSGIVRKGKQHIVQIGANGRTDQSFSSPVSTNQQPVYGANWLAQTFTPSINGAGLVIELQLYRVQNTMNYLILHIQGVSGGLPNGTDLYEPITFDASQITQTSFPGGTYYFYMPADQFIVSGTPLALVLEYPNGDSSDNIQWMRNASGSVSGGAASNSSNSGGTWSPLAGAFSFVERIVSTVVPYTEKPLGNFSPIINGIGRNVVVFDQPDSNTGVLYYWDPTANTFPNWRASTLNNLNPTNFVRFATMNGSIFMVNGSNTMVTSADYGATWGTNNAVFSDDQVVPSLILASQNLMLVTGWSTYPDRIYFSSVIDPTQSEFITFDSQPTIGDFIDVNPGVDGVITALIPNSSLVLVFKTNAMYRLNTVSKSIDAENIYNVGAVSQEAVVNCLGVTYFYSGNGIYQTDSTFPQLISRIGVQDFVDAITKPNEVYAWQDGFNVYFSIGAVTLTLNPEDIRSYSNVILKFSPRDQNWQVFTYNQHLAQTSTFGPEAATFAMPATQFLTQEYDGYISFVNTTTTGDDGTAIPYSLETQEQEFGNRAHTKNLSNQIVTYNRNGGDGMFLVKANDGNFKSVNLRTNGRVNVGTDINSEGQFFTFRWQGQALGQRPVFEGYHLPTITDLGVTLNSNIPN